MKMDACRALCARIVENAVAQAWPILCRGEGPVWFYCLPSIGTTPGEIVVCRDGDEPPAGCDVLDPRPERGSRTREQLAAWLDGHVGRLPVLPREVSP